MTTETKEYKLGPYHIEEVGEGLYWWSTWANRSDESLDIMSGKGFLESEVNLLILGPWKVANYSEFKNWKDVEQFLDKFPRWDKTKYYIKFADIGNSPVMLCETSEVAPKDIQKSLRDWWNRKHEPESSNLRAS